MAYRLALIGCGNRGKEYAKGVHQDGQTEVVGLADPKTEAAQETADTNGWKAPVFADYREMLAQTKPDVVTVALWTALHLPVFKDCLEAGVKGVMMEKPMAPTWGETKEMAALAQESGCVLTFCHQRRFAPGNQLARKLLKEGRFGKVERFDLYSPPHLLDCGTHTFDQALSFNEESPAKWVLGGADLSNPVSFFNVKAESTSVGQVIFQNGVRANFQFGGPDMDIWGGLRLYGSEGYFEIMWDGIFKRAVVYSDPSWKVEEITEDPNEFVMQHVVADLLNALKTGEEPELSYKKAFRAAEIIFALYQSIRTRRKIELPLTGLEDNPIHDLLAQEPSC